MSDLGQTRDWRQRCEAAEARVTELEAALTEAIGWIEEEPAYEEPHDDLRLRFIDELRAALAPTKEDG